MYYLVFSVTAVTFIEDPRLLQLSKGGYKYTDDLLAPERASAELFLVLYGSSLHSPFWPDAWERSLMAGNSYALNQDGFLDWGTGGFPIQGCKLQAESSL